MAILEIARIQVRRGQENVTGLPQLASGEFGWAVDTQKLYIGNGSLEEGAPFVGNTEVITANSLFKFLAATDSTYLFEIPVQFSLIHITSLPYRNNNYSCRMLYSLVKPVAGVVRKGELVINVSNLGTPEISITDDYSYTGPNSGNLEFSAELNTVANTVDIYYTSSDSDGTLSYNYKQFQ